MSENEILLASKRSEQEAIISELNASEAGKLAQQASVLEEAQRLEARISEARLDIEAEKMRLEAEAAAKRAEIEAANTAAEREDRQDELSVIETRSGRTRAALTRTALELHLSGSKPHAA